MDLSLCRYQLDQQLNQQQLTLSWRVAGKPDERAHKEPNDNLGL